MKRTLVSAALMGACALAIAKLPPLDDAAKAKAAEVGARSAWQGKVDAFQLCKSQDKVASHYRKTAGSAPARGVNGSGAQPPSASTVPGAPPAMITAAATPTAVPAPAAAAPAASTAGAAAAQGCAEPGPFAYTPTEQKPLEAAGAHSPTTTAASPPSTRAPEATTGPAPTSAAAPAGAASATPTPAK